MTAAMFDYVRAILSELVTCDAVSAGDLELMELGISLVRSNAAMTRDMSQRFVKQVRPLLLAGEVSVSNELLRALSGGLCPIKLREGKITPEVSRRVQTHLSLINGCIQIG